MCVLGPVNGLQSIPYSPSISAPRLKGRGFFSQGRKEDAREPRWREEDAREPRWKVYEALSMSMELKNGEDGLSMCAYQFCGVFRI